MRGVQTHALCNKDFNSKSTIYQTRRELDSWYGETRAANITPTSNGTAKARKKGGEAWRAFAHFYGQGQGGVACTRVSAQRYRALTPEELAKYTELGLHGLRA